METEDYKRHVAVEIKKRVIELRQQGKKTVNGEPMSLAAIGRTMDPPVSRVTVYLVVEGKSESARVKEAIEKNLGRPYWIKKRAAGERLRWMV